MPIYKIHFGACIVCGDGYETKSSRNKWCSDLCQIIGSSDVSGGDDACWNWQKGLRHGYGFLKCRTENHAMCAHRKIYEIIHRIDLPSDIAVRHKCDNRLCVNPAHLEEGTRADNHRDMVERGRERHNHGEDHHNAQITNEQAHAVWDAEGKAEDIAVQTGVPLHTVWNIRAGNGWKHITKGQKRAKKQKSRNLTNEQIIEIYNSKESGSKLAEKYGSHTSTICLVRNGRLWADITGHK